MAYTIRCWCPTCEELREWRRGAGRVQPYLAEQLDSIRSTGKVLARLVRLYMSAGLDSLLGMAKDEDRASAADRKANQRAAKQKAGIESRARGVIQREQIRNKDLREGTNTERQSPKHRKG